MLAASGPELDAPPSQCPRCLDCQLEWEDLVPGPKCLARGEEGAWCQGLLCRNCARVCLLEGGKGERKEVGEWLQEEGREGWLLAEGERHRWLQAVLNNVVYFLEEPADLTKTEVDFSLPAHTDQVEALVMMGMLEFSEIQILL